MSKRNTDNHLSSQKHIGVSMSTNSDKQQQQHDGQRQASEKIKCKQQYTSIGAIFGPELLIMKLFGGIMFDIGKILGLAYRIAIVFVSRYFEFKIFINTKDIVSKFEAIATLNVRIMLMVYQLSTVITLVCTIITGLKYHNLIMVILKKRLDQRYVNVLHKIIPVVPGEFSIGEVKSSFQTSSITRKLGSRVNQLRILLMLNLFLTTLSCYGRDRLFVQNETGFDETSEVPAPDVAVTTTTPATTTTSFDRTTSNSTKPDLSMPEASLFTFDLFMKQEEDKVMFVIKEIIWFVLESVRATMNVYQIYGTMIINFIITAVLTEMLNFSANYDRIINERANRTEIYLIDSEVHRRRGKLLTSELLVQIRDVLLTLGRTMNTNCLLIMVYDVSRLMSVFCLFTAALSDNRISSSSFLVIDYIRVSFSILFSRLGYFWLHAEVRNIKHALAENRLLTNDKYAEDNVTGDNDSSTNGFSDSYSSGNSFVRDRASNHQVVANHAEVITSYRLADQIENMWPTDWFKPDIKNYLSQNIFVITFVATLQQLVEAASAKTEPV